jgi:hypothetical protein
MKVVQETSRVLQLKQVNWMPWYGHLMLWPTAFVLMCVSIAGQTSTFVCQRSTGQCELNNSTSKNPEKRTIAISKIKNFDLVATDSTNNPDTQIKLITEEGEFNVGLDGSYADRDAAAGKLAWFFEDTSTKYIKLENHTRDTALGAGLVGLSLLGLAFGTRKTSTALFDKDTDRCVTESSRFFGLAKGKREICKLPSISGVERSASLKVAADRILLNRSNGSGFFLTDSAMGKPDIEMAAVQKIRDFLQLGHTKQPANSDDEEYDGDITDTEPTDSLDS